MHDGHIWGKFEAVPCPNADTRELEWRRRTMELWEPIVEAAKAYISSYIIDMDDYDALCKAIDELYHAETYDGEDCESR